MVQSAAALPATYKAVVVEKAGGDFKVIDRPMPTPGKTQVLIKVEACGLCHSDSFVKEGLFPGITYPRVPGHEAVGRIVKVGSEVFDTWTPGSRVGVGWAGGHCFACTPCRQGKFVHCAKGGITGITYDGGYQEYMLAPQEALARIPDELSAAEAAPLMCAGVTVFNAIRNAPNLRPGDIVAVQGIGGLGHLAVAYATKMGYRVVAISGSDSKKDLAHKLGAHSYIDSSKGSVAEALQAMGGATLIVSTVSDPALIKGLEGALAIRGTLMLLAPCHAPVEINVMSMIPKSSNVSSWASGSAIDSEECVAFSKLTSVLPLVETFKLADASKAYDRMMSNKARFRVSLTF